MLKKLSKWFPLRKPCTSTMKNYENFIHLCVLKLYGLVPSDGSTTILLGILLLVSDFPRRIRCFVL